MFARDVNIIGFLQSIGWPELLIVLVIALLIWGRRLPDVARSLGKSVTQFKKGMKETEDEIEKAVTDEDENKNQKKQ